MKLSQHLLIAFGLAAAFGLLAGVVKARETGLGMDVDTSLFDVALRWPRWSVHLDHPFATTRQELGEPGPVAAGANR